MDGHISDFRLLLLAALIRAYPYVAKCPQSSLRPSRLCGAFSLGTVFPDLAPFSGEQDASVNWPGLRHSGSPFISQPPSSSRPVTELYVRPCPQRRFSREAAKPRSREDGRRRSGLHRHGCHRSRPWILFMGSTPFLRAFAASREPASPPASCGVCFHVPEPGASVNWPSRPSLEPGFDPGPLAYSRPVTELCVRPHYAPDDFTR